MKLPSKLPIGYSDFKEIIEESCYFVDKSLFIKQIIDDGKVIVITRPRRFGKTLNMSMLRYFFSSGEGDTSHLFEHLQIASHADLLAKHQQKYPVVYLTFKDLKGSHYDVVYDKMVAIIQNAYDKFSRDLLHSDKLTDYQKDNITHVLRRNASQTDMENSLLMLSEALFDHYGSKICIIIDEYDTVIQCGYMHGYYNDIIGFFRNFLGCGLKDNRFLFKAVLTGILRVSKESLFSGLNNLKVYSVLHHQYAPYFGFVESEVALLLKNTGLEEKSEAIKSWYNGYRIGDYALYNPWSILNCVDEHGVLQPYWVNTSDNALIKKLLIESTYDFRFELESLFRGDFISQLVNENISEDLQNYIQSSAPHVWTLLLVAGYLTARSCQNTDQGLLCELIIPNGEIQNLYRNIIEEWLSNKKEVHEKEVYFPNQFFEHLIYGN